MRILDSIRTMLTNKSSVQMVADDPHLASEIMLLVRMMFIDGELNGPELDLFKQYCHSVFDIPEEDVPAQNPLLFLGMSGEKYRKYNGPF